MGLGSPIDFDEGWGDIEWAIFKLIRILEWFPEPPFDAEDYMVIYSTIYNMCIQKAPHDHSEHLYEAYRESIEAYNAEIVLPSFTDKHGELLVLEFVRRWRNHEVLMRWLWHFFIVLDQYYVYKAKVPGLKQVGLIGFREQVFPKLKDNARAAVMGLIHEEREGGLIDRALLKDAIDIFVVIGNGEMSVYETDFEEHMMRGTCEYYSRRASDWIVEASGPDYMFKAEECLRREKERVSHYLHSSSEQKLLEKVHYELVVVYAHHLLDKRDSGCSALLRDNKEADLARMYRLYNRTPKSLELVVNAFKKHVINEGKAFVQQAEDAASNQQASNAEHGVVLITKIIEMYDKYMGYVIDFFMKDSLFQKAMREAFEVFCNIPVSGSPSAELLAGFCDSILKKGGWTGCQYSDEAIDENFEKVVKVLAYFNDKDVFVEFCRKKLARRLLFDRSANNDHEKSFLTKLKQNCGGQFTAKMEGMVTDLTLAKDTRTNFENFLDSNPNVQLGIDLTVTILTTGYWPSYKSDDLNLPEEMVKCVDVFKGFFDTQKKLRKLSWIYSLGTCNVIAKFEPKTMELVVSTYQGALLLLFNYADKLSFSDISTQLNLTNEGLVRLLHSLSCAKYKILIKEPNNKTISPNDNFMFNSKFTDKMKRIKTPLPPVDERTKVIEEVDKDRRYAIDAAIVRIMKSRKVLGHQELVTESVEQLQRMFKPDIKAIKKRIEDLITREYLERDEGNPTMFKYLA